MKKIFSGFGFCLPFVIAVLGVTSAAIKSSIVEPVVAIESSFEEVLEIAHDNNSENDDEGLRTTFTYFNGTATDVTIGDTISSYFYYPAQKKFYRFHCPTRMCASINYSGPSSSIRIFYSNFFADSDYLVSYQYISNAVDCYVFDQDCEYIIELACYSIGSPTSFGFHLEKLTTSNLANHRKYVFHQIFDSNSNVGYHYETLFFDVSETDYIATSCYINSSSISIAYVFGIIKSITFCK